MDEDKNSQDVGKKELVGFRASPETKQLLEDIATASGYNTMQDFMADVAKGVIANVPASVMRTVREIQARRRKPVVPKIEFPKERT